MKTECCGATVGEHHGWTPKKGIENPKYSWDYELTERKPYCHKCGEPCTLVQGFIKRKEKRNEAM